MQKRSLFPTVVIEIFLIAFSFICIYPFVWMILSSFKNEGEILTNAWGLPKGLNFNFYYEVLTGKIGNPFLIYVKNSFIVTLCSLFFMCIIATMASYGLARFKFKGNRVINFFIIIMFTIPLQAYFVSLFVQLRDYKMLNSLVTLIILYVTCSLPFAIMILMGYFRTFPTSIEEAAIIDGCSEFKKMVYIVIPIAKSAIATLAIINFAGYWNELLLALIVINDNVKRTVNMGVLDYRSQYSVKLGHSFAALSIAVIPILMFFFIFQKQIMRGITVGSVKG